jgi:hypothetical protein
MSADKPLQDIYSTVRIPVTDTVITNDNQNTGGLNNVGGKTAADNGLYWNCYPTFFSDRAQNQYSSQFDTWVEKRGPLRSSGGPALFADSNPYFQRTDITNPNNNLCITGLDDYFIMSFWNNTTSNHKILAYRPIAQTQSNTIGAIPAAGQSAGDTIFITEGVIGGNPTLFISWRNAAGTSSAGYFSTYSGGAWSAIAALGGVFPSNIIGPIIQMNAFVYVLTQDGKIYNSNTGTTTFTALGFTQAQLYPDQGISLGRHKHFLVCFGEDSIEFFADAGKPAPGSPLQRTEAAYINFGAASPKSILTMDDNIFWWSKSSRGKWGLYMLDGYTPVKISTLKEDLLAARNPTLPHLYSYMDRGRLHVMTSIGVSSAMLYYGTRNNSVPAASNDYTSQPATFPSSGDASSFTYTDFTAGYLCFEVETRASWVFSFSAFQGAFPLQAQNFTALNSGSFQNQTTALFVVYSYLPPQQSTGYAGLGHNLHVISSAGTDNNSYVYIDSGLFIQGSTQTSSYVTMAIQFNTWDFGNEKRKRIHKFKIINREPGYDNNNSTYPYTYLVYNKSDFDFSGTGTDGTITKFYRKAWKPSQAIARTYFNNLGSARKWTFAIVQKSGSPFSVKAIELDISQGSS